MGKWEQVSKWVGRSSDGKQQKTEALLQESWEKQDLKQD